MKTILFDRDGTLILDPQDLRVDRLDKIELFEDSISSLKRLHEAGYSIIMITNQAGISEGRLRGNDFYKINAEVINQLEPSGINILDVHMCPHVNEDKCVCRKPNPTMLNEALRKFKLVPSETFMIGDSVTDIDAAINAGCKSILVKTANSPQSAPQATYEAKNLTDAVDFILKS